MKLYLKVTFMLHLLLSLLEFPFNIKTGDREWRDSGVVVFTSVVVNTLNYDQKYQGVGITKLGTAALCCFHRQGK